MATTTQNALGTAQSNLELAHKELTLARAAYTKAKERLDLAETEYTNSRLTLNKSVESIQQFCHMQPFGL